MPSLFLCISFHSHAPHCHCHAKLIYAFALLSVALPCYALALPFASWLCLCRPWLSLSLLCLCPSPQFLATPLLFLRSALQCTSFLCPCCAFLSHAIRCDAFALRRRSLHFGAWPCPRAYSKMSENSAALSSKISQRNLPLPLFLHCPSPRSFP